MQDPKVIEAPKMPEPIMQERSHERFTSLKWSLLFLDRV
jgi:hypothetical protein